MNTNTAVTFSAYALALTLATAVLGGCGNETSTEDRPQTSASSGAAKGGTPATCLTAADVSTLLGLEVREFRAGTQTDGTTSVCAYQGADSKLGAFVTTIAGPAEQSDSEKRFASMRESVKLFAGTNAELEAIQVGERGHAYGSSSKSEAAAISQGRLYHAEVISSASADIGDKKAGLIEIVKKLIGQ